MSLFTLKSYNILRTFDISSTLRTLSSNISAAFTINQDNGFPHCRFQDSESRNLSVCSVWCHATSRLCSCSSCAGVACAGGVTVGAGLQWHNITWTGPHTAATIARLPVSWTQTGVTVTTTATSQPSVFHRAPRTHARPVLSRPRTLGTRPAHIICLKSWVQYTAPTHPHTTPILGAVLWSYYYYYFGVFLKGHVHPRLRTVEPHSIMQSCAIVDF